MVFPSNAATFKVFIHFKAIVLFLIYLIYSDRMSSLVYNDEKYYTILDISILPEYSL
jgi:hypothetical protein